MQKTKRCGTGLIAATLALLTCEKTRRREANQQTKLVCSGLKRLQAFILAGSCNVIARPNPNIADNLTKHEPDVTSPYLHYMIRLIYQMFRCKLKPSKAFSFTLMFSNLTWPRC